MTVRIFLRGGLGNQLYQYATAYSLSRTLGARLRIDCSLLPKTQDNFKGVSRWPEQISSFEHFGSLDMSSFQPQGRTSAKSKMITAQVLWMSRLSRTRQLRRNFITDENVLEYITNLNQRTKQSNKPIDIKLFGYFQKEELFAEHLSRICSQMANIQKPSPGYLRTKKRISEDSVALHVRMGDKSRLTPVYTSDLFTRLDLTLSSLREKPSRVLVYSDSAGVLDSRKLSGSPQLEFVDTQNLLPIETLNLLASSKTIIGSDSTFFWWASKLQKLFDPRGTVITY
jgi:hypothetical protein